MTTNSIAMLVNSACKIIILMISYCITKEHVAVAYIKKGVEVMNINKNNIFNIIYKAINHIS